MIYWITLGIILAAPSRTEKETTMSEIDCISGSLFLAEQLVGEGCIDDIKLKTLLDKAKNACAKYGQL